MLLISTEKAIIDLCKDNEAKVVDDAKRLVCYDVSCLYIGFLEVETNLHIKRYFGERN